MPKRPPTRTPAAQRAYDLARGRSPHRRYNTQKKNAKRRGIEFRLTFDEWWAVWEKSGRWADYGKGGKKYSMSRFGDQGAYEVGNVEIITGAANSLENSLRIDFPAVGRAARAAKRRKNL